VSLLDKTVLYRYARTPLTLPLLVGIAHPTLGVVILATAGIPDDVVWSAAGIALVSGALFGLFGMILMRVLFTQEVSRTIPVTQTAPIFAALMGLAFLNETLSALQWAAVFSTVAGAALLSLRKDGGYNTIFLHRSFYLLIVGANIFAVANILGAVAVDDLPVLFTHAVRSIGLGGVFLAFSVRKGPMSDLRRFITTRSPALLFVAVNEFLIANTALLLMLWALSLGPVALVTALIGTRALLVVLYSTGLALVWKGFLGEETTSGTLVVKLASAVLIVGGVVGIAI
jgi:drug/metabolite transporter (DMT)-like permease